jgi:PAS domain S-box-containing protein
VEDFRCRFTISMPKNGQNGKFLSGGSTQESSQRSAVSSRFEQFERRQNELWRLTFLLLLVLGVVFAWISWGTIRSLAHHFEALPIGLVILIVLFGAYAWNRTREISELRGLMRGLDQRDAVPPSDKQMDQLFEIIARSQQGYRDLIDSFEDVLLALSLEGDIRAVNRSFADLVGQSFQQIIGRQISDFLEEVNGEGKELVERAMPRFLERRHWSGVVQVRLKSRNTVHYLDCVIHAMLRGDTVHGITILARDITAQRRNEARFTELFESLQEGIYIVTPDDKILDINPALVRMLGYDSKEDLRARDVSEIFPDAALRSALREEVERQPIVEGREITLLRKDGRPIVCLNTAAAVRDNFGKIVRYQGSLMDITARREIERRLYKQQEFARRLVDSFPDLILVLDTSAHYTFISPSIREVLGYEPDESTDLEFGDRTHSEDRPALRALYGEFLAGRQAFASLEVRVRHKNGDWRRIRCHFSPLINEEGISEGVVISGRDVTELKRLEEQLIQAEKLAAMGQMLAGVAHELNNPLTAILGVTELVRERQDVDDSMKRQLDLTHRQARRAARIVQNLLEFSRPASPQKKAIDINSIIDRTLQLHEHSLRRNNIAVDFRPQPGIPGVIGDGNQLIQIFLNLVTNAEQAIREVRDNGRIQIRIAHSNHRVSVTVQDDGVGISPEALPRIFDPFYTTKRPGGGTGLGLSICMSILREHGGSIEAAALPAGGSAFTVTMPAATEEQQLESRSNTGDAAATETVPPASVISKERNILVLDDEESIRILLAEGLAANGLHVDCVGTVEDALQLVAQKNYDALLCDLNLGPRGEKAGASATGGKEAAVRILAAAGERKPAVIFMTGEYMDEMRRSEELGGAACLQKPFRILDVLAELRKAAAPGSEGKLPGDAAS